MKRWMTRFEWMIYAKCVGDERHTSECLPGSEESKSAALVCADCLVRKECIEWALENSFTSTIVAGVHIPDPERKREVKSAHLALRKLLTLESGLERDL